MSPSFYLQTRGRAAVIVDSLEASRSQSLSDFPLTVHQNRQPTLVREPASSVSEMNRDWLLVILDSWPNICRLYVVIAIEETNSRFLYGLTPLRIMDTAL